MAKSLEFELAGVLNQARRLANLPLLTGLHTMSAEYLTQKISETLSASSSGIPHGFAEGDPTGYSANLWITVSAGTTGTFTLTFNGETTGNIAADADAATVRAALVAAGCFADEDLAAEAYEDYTTLDEPVRAVAFGLAGALANTFMPDDPVVGDGGISVGAVQCFFRPRGSAGVQDADAVEAVHYDASEDLGAAEFPGLFAKVQSVWNTVTGLVRRVADKGTVAAVLTNNADFQVRALDVAGALRAEAKVGRAGAWRLASQSADGSTVESIESSLGSVSTTANGGALGAASVQLIVQEGFQGIVLRLRDSESQEIASLILDAADGQAYLNGQRILTEADLPI